MPVDYPVWNPSVAAGAGAGFAGILGAIIVSVTFQIVISGAKVKVRINPGQAMTGQLIAPFAVITSLAAAYLYVVLSGTTSTVDRLDTACRVAKNVTSPDCRALSSAVQSVACMFAIGGSYLALGAIAMTFTLVLVVEERHPEPLGTVRSATLLLFTTGVLVAVSALLYGYRDAVWVINARKLTIGEYLSSGFALVVTAGGLLLGLVAGEIGRVIKRSRKRPPVILGWIAINLYVLAPVLWYLSVEGTNPGDRPVGSSWVTQAMLAWVTITVGFFIYWLPQSEYLRRELPRAKLERVVADRSALTNGGRGRVHESHRS